MNVKQAQAVKGKYGILQIGDRFDSGRIRAISPSGNFVEVDWAWQKVENVTFVEELPEPPVAEGPATLTEPAVQGADLAATNQKLQEENTSLTGQIAQEQAAHSRATAELSEQLNQARQEIAGLKQALAAEAKPTTPTGANEPNATITFPTGS